MRQELKIKIFCKKYQYFYSVAKNSSVSISWEFTSRKISTLSKLELLSNMLSSTYPQTKLHLKILETFSIANYVWPSSRPYPIYLETSKKISRYKINLTFHAFYGFLLSFNYICTVGRLDIVRKLLATELVATCIVPLAIRLNTEFIEKSGPIRLMRAFDSFESVQIHKSLAGSNRTIQVLKLLQLLGMVTGFLMPVCTGALLIIEPCMPPYLGYVLLKWNGTCHIISGAGCWALLTEH